MSGPGPTLEGIRAAHARVAPHLIRTPVLHLPAPVPLPEVAPASLDLKLEFLQRTGTFKARGALNAALTLPTEALRAGVTAASAGNHAIAVAFAARVAGTSAKVVMHRAADPARVALCRAYGAEVVLADDIDDAFRTVMRIRDNEGRAFLHPFDGIRTWEGTGTVGLELLEDVAQPPEVVLVAIGGGGLMAGVGAAVRALAPAATLIGVEPTGADGMRRSLERGRALERVEVDTVADSLGAPLHTQDVVDAVAAVCDRIVTVDDDALCRAVADAYDAWRFALEPAAAAVLAALQGPLAAEIRDRRVAAIVCGSNLSEERFASFLARGREVAARP
ncbi:MAG: pyridoxal-phosphate dependent enzyme [Trueperaceae bacterium]